MRKVFTLSLTIGLMLGLSSPAHSTPTAKVSNVLLTAVGVEGGELSATWTPPASFDGDFAGYAVRLKNESGGIVETRLFGGEQESSALFVRLTNDAVYSVEVATRYQGQSDVTELVVQGLATAKPYGLPTAPAKPVISRTNSGEIYIDWEAPANNGSAISEYSVVCVPVCPVSPLTTTNTHVTISGLNTATPYTATVTAKNQRGDSLASVASDAITPHANVIAPTGVVMTAGDSQAVASWAAVTISGATVSSYSVQLFLESAPSNVVQTKSVATTSTTFTGLTNGLRYFFKVSTVVGSITSAPATSLFGLTAAAVVVTPPTPPEPPAPPAQVISAPAAEPAAAPAAAPAPTQPTSKVKQKTAGASLATQIGMTVTPKAKIKLTVAKASKKICKVSGGKLVALKPGNCSVTVSVTPAKTKAVKKPKATKKSTVVSIS